MLTEQITQLLVKKKRRFTTSYGGLMDIEFNVKDPDLLISVIKFRLYVNDEEITLEELEELV